MAICSCGGLSEFASEHKLGQTMRMPRSFMEAVAHAPFPSLSVSVVALATSALATSALTGCAGTNGDADFNASPAAYPPQEAERTPAMLVESAADLAETDDDNSSQITGTESSNATQEQLPNETELNNSELSDTSTDEAELGEYNLELNRLEAILARSCGRCHGAEVSPRYAAAGITYIADIEKLFNVGLLLPGDSGNSQVIQIMRRGTMPPSDAEEQPFSEEELRALEFFVDAPIFY